MDKVGMRLVIIYDVRCQYKRSQTLHYNSPVFPKGTVEKQGRPRLIHCVWSKWMLEGYGANIQIIMYELSSKVPV